MTIILHDFTLRLISYIATVQSTALISLIIAAFSKHFNNSQPTHNILKNSYIKVTIG